MMGMDALDGYWMEHMLVLMVFWMGWGGLEWFLDDLGLILMDLDVVGRVFGWFLMVLQGFWMNVGWICDGRCMEFWLLYVFLIF